MNVAALIRILGAKGMSADDIADVVELAMPAEPTRAERKRDRDRERISAKREAERLSQESRDMSDIARQSDTLSSGSEGSPKPLPTPPNLSQEPPIVPQKTASKARRKGDFAKFWAEYPLKVGKGKAEPAYDRALRRCEGEDPEAEILEGLLRCKPLFEPEFIPHATTWLNRDGWLDQLVPEATGPPGATVIDADAVQRRREENRRLYEEAL